MAMKLSLFKIIRDTNLWKKGQKVWGVSFTGALAYVAIGRKKGKEKWIAAWIHVADATDGRGFKGSPDSRFIDDVEVSDAFYSKIKEIAEHRGYWLD